MKLAKQIALALVVLVIHVIIFYFLIESTNDEFTKGFLVALRFISAGVLGWNWLDWTKNL